MPLSKRKKIETKIPIRCHGFVFEVEELKVEANRATYHP